MEILPASAWGGEIEYLWMSLQASPPAATRQVAPSFVNTFWSCSGSYHEKVSIGNKLLIRRNIRQ